MDGVQPGACMIWRPSAGGIKATVTVMAVDLDHDRVQVHVKKASTGLCASHWVDLAALSEAPADAQPCACHDKPRDEPGKDDHAA